MNFSGISLQQSPPYFVTIKFFITAPLFLLLCGILLIYGDLGGNASDFAIYNSFKSLAFMHSMTLGFMLFSMLGALQQMLPVLGGVNIKYATSFSHLAYFSAIFGSMSVIFGFNFSMTNLLFFGSLIMLFSAIFFASVVVFKLFRANFTTHTIKGMIIATIFLPLVVFCGVLLAHFYAFGEFFGGVWTLLADLNPFDFLQNLHVKSAIFGWIFLLIVAVSYQVLPMFYVAPDYHKNFRRFFVPLTAFIVVLSAFFDFFSLILQVLAIIYGIYNIRILKARKRKNSIDTTIRYWYFGAICLIFGAVAGILDYLLPLFADFSHSSDQNNTLNLHYMSLFLLVFGFGGSVVSGMLYKIVPFLTWFHLSATGNFSIPSIREIIKEKYMFAQFALYCVFIASFVLNLYLGFFWVSGVILSLGALLQLLNLILSIRVYLRFR
ncbi:hypothetical protein CCY99_08375 [Helicobacter sp. 16-1353]|uniref:hypothetical protein n=1 Tax=Helicobacter sp. 16-1353 TaxID=2004996 RepID=UPI000DCE4E93|nr:hypothetical protein [Helicobacter sp. 16-1353]RAX51806.1 hypothetical protein CCY99_08375 [Helicobacter sp. 16-1353]